MDNDKNNLVSPLSSHEMVDHQFIDQLRKLIDDGTSRNSKRAFDSDLQFMTQWALSKGMQPELPWTPLMVIRFIIDHMDDPSQTSSDKKLSITTIRRRISSLSKAHRMHNHRNPCLDDQVREIIGNAARAAVNRGYKKRKKEALVKSLLDKVLEPMKDDVLIDVRDKAILLCGFSSGGRRRSEIASMTCERLKRVKDEYIYELGVTKTNQTGEGIFIPFAGRSAYALSRWLEMSQLNSGYLFRQIIRNSIGDGISEKMIWRIVQKRAKAVGLDWKKFGAHSLRSGFMTEAGLQNINILEAMALSQHKDIQTASEYYQGGSGLNNKAARLADD